MDNGRRGNNMSTRLVEMESGYDVSSTNWEAFLNCWHEKEARLLESSEQESSQIVRFARAVPKGASREAINEQLAKTTRFNLPPSYIDFLSTYSALEGTFIEPDKTGEPGFFGRENVKQLREYDPDLGVVDEQWAIESDDDHYYRYGIGQDTSSGRNSYLPQSLVVGRFGTSNYEVMLLYPDSLTKDGEMEAAILSHSCEFRAPAFAELVRQRQINVSEVLYHART